MIKVAVHGLPRSGTTLVGEIINSSASVCYKFQPLFSYACKNYLGPQSDAVVIGQFFQSLVNLEDEFCDQARERASGELPTFTKVTPTHSVYKEVRYHNILHNMARKCDEVRFVFVVRDPLQVMASWIRAPREFRSDLGWRVEEEWRYALKKNLNNQENFYGFEKWKEGMLMFADLKHRFPERVQIVNYQSLERDIFETTRRLFSFLELPLEEQTYRFLDQCRKGGSKTAYGVFRSPARPRFSLEKEFPAIAKEIQREVAASCLGDLLS